MLTKKKITRKLENYQEIKELMKRSFPENELYPMWFLLLVSKIKKVDFSAFYEDDKLIGCIYLIKSKKVAYLMYIFVNDKIQSQGYGTKILKQVMKDNKDKEIVLDIEPLDENASNHEQREKRYHFYKKNGFKTTSYFIEDEEDPTDYTILSTDGTFSKKECEKLLRGLSYGTYKRRYKRKKRLSKKRNKPYNPREKKNKENKT